MQNYLMLNNKKIELTNEQIEKIKNIFGINTTSLSDVPVGETFKVGELEFIVLKHIQGTTYVLSKDFWKTAKFDDNSNNYDSSDIRNELNTDFYSLICNAIGKDNIIEHTVNLTSDDGRTDYGECIDYISLLTCDMYRKYVYIVDKYRITSDWWWLATPYSTSSNGYDVSVRCVDDGGTLGNSSCYNCSGVRPFSIFSTSIF